MAIIMISRGTLSGGKAVADRVAERLGYPSLSREETVREAVEKYRIPEDELTAAMSELPPFWQQVHGKRISFLKVFSAVLMDHIQGGNLVYNGHAPHLALGPISHVLSVRVIADMEFRIAGAMARKNLNREGAIAFIQKIDKQRDRWTRFLYGVDWKDPALYDVLFNLERMSIDVAVDAIVYMASMDAFKPTPQSQKALDDLILSSRVWSALAINGLGMVTNITVSTNAGIVIISGGAPSAKAISSIIAVAQKVEGVKEVKTDVGVGPDWYW
jgi:cytidylate kinase